MQTLINRETWLMAALPPMIALLDQNGAPTFATPLISVGFPHGVRGSKKAKAIGQCWTIPGQDRAHIFVHPCLSDPQSVLGVLIHELVHAAVGAQCGHRGPFAKVARAIGLEGRLTSTVPGSELTMRLTQLANRLGVYPHQALDPEAVEKARKKQTTRQRKYDCPSCGQIVRAATDSLEILCMPCSRAGGNPVTYRLA